MSVDYRLYNELYHRMSSVVDQINGLSQSTSQMNKGIGIQGQSFSDTMRRTASSLGVPESMDAIFEEAAQIYDVPVHLLKAMGKAESGFNASAVSPAGAQGVMQLMPATAQALGVSDPFDARSNIMGGAKYISDMLQRYDGDVDLALAAYNAGSGNVAKYGGVPPFRETQNYIARIKEYMGMDLHTGQTVAGTAANADAEKERVLSAGGAGFSIDNALYLIEMMKLQMQSRVADAGLSLISDDENNLWL